LKQVRYNTERRIRISPPSRGARIETVSLWFMPLQLLSPPSRGARIETIDGVLQDPIDYIAPFTGGAD